jgi:hypothetical protein
MHLSQPKLYPAPSVEKDVPHCRCCAAASECNPELLGTDVGWAPGAGEEPRSSGTPRSMGLVPAQQLVCRVSLRRACQVEVEAQCPCKATQLVSMERLGHDQRNYWGWRRMLSIMTQHQQVRHSSHAPDNQPIVVCSPHMLMIRS